MSFEFFLAKRFLTGRRFGVFRWITTTIAIFGTALGVAALLITLAVMDGFRNDIQSKILGTQPHLLVVSPFGTPIPFDPLILDQIQKAPTIQDASPYLGGQALIQTDQAMLGILLRGVNPSREGFVTRFNDIFTQGSPTELNGPTIALGQEMAKNLSLSIGDTLTLIAPQDSQKGIQTMPRLRKLKVVGLFKSGMYEIDANLAYVSIETAQDVFGHASKITGYGARLKSIDQTPKSKKLLQDNLGGSFWVRSWHDLNKNLFSAIQLERTVMFIILTLIILVSTFIIISNLLLLTIEKAPEIGILQALGASRTQIQKIFVLHGLLLGASGVLLGLILGCGISYLLKTYPIIKLPADVYYVDQLPIQLSGITVLSVAVCALVLVFLAILFPSKKARDLDPIQAIRHG